MQVATPDYSIGLRGVHVDGYALYDSPGAPELPVWRTVVELPDVGGWVLSFESAGSRQLPFDGTIRSVPVPDLNLAGADNWLDRRDLPTSVPEIDLPDPSIYGRDAFFPAVPVQAGAEQWYRGRRLLAIEAFPFQYNPVSGILQYHPDLRITIRIDVDQSAAKPDSKRVARLMPGVSQMMDGAVRVRTGQRGLHRLTYSDLQSAGVPLDSVDPATFAMSYLSQPVDIQVADGNDDSFDPGDLVIFYAEPYEGRYMTHNVYRFSYGGMASADRMDQRAVIPTGSEPLITTITQTVRVEENRDYRSNYQLARDADHYFDNVLYPNIAFPTVTVTYPLDPLVALQAAPGTALVKASLHGGTDQVASPDQSVVVRLNDHEIGTFQWNGSVPYLAIASVPSHWLDGLPNVITLEAATSQLPDLFFYWVSPDWVEVTLPAYPVPIDDRIDIEAISVAGQRAQVQVPGFSTDTISVYDVRDPRHPVQLTTVQANGSGGNHTIAFWDEWAHSAPTPSYSLSSREALLVPLAEEIDSLSSWASPENRADYIAILHRSLWNEIDPLLDHRASEGLRVAKIDVQDLFDEFSGGRLDPEAIRSFLAYAFGNWNQAEEPPQFVLLVGDGHFDFRDDEETGLPNLIPPYLIHIDPWLGETASDNRYVSIDGPDDFLPDMAIGRIPAKTGADVSAVVDKILAYEEAPRSGDWRQRAVFVADNNMDPAGSFHSYSDDIIDNWLPPSYEAERVYYRMDPAHDTGEEMRTAIKEAFDGGAVYLQWFGHASQHRWGSVSMYDILDPASLVPTDQHPFAVHYSCWSGYFIGIDGDFQYGDNEQSLGEVLLLTPERAAVADLSPSGLHIGSALRNMNRGLVKAMFQDRLPRVGQVVDSARLFFFENSGYSHDLIDTSILFADPALNLKAPSMMYLPYLVAETSQGY
ncbi:MAG: C25 family cysteine peptidase [Chloroflexota bacterium]|nr:C25 family cysteine peptidase [Chloroflexota bacterium]